MDALLDSIDSRQWSEWMAFDRIEPPDLWPSATARLLYRLVCAWSTGPPPKFADFLPATRPHNAAMSEQEILTAFGVRPRSPRPGK